MRAYESNNKILPICMSLKAEDRGGAISAAIYFLIGIDVDFVVTN